MKEYNGYRSYASFLTCIYIDNTEHTWTVATDIIKSAESYHHALKALTKMFEGDYTLYDNNLIRRIHLAEWLEANWGEYRNADK